MKLTKSQLKELIRNSIRSVVSEEDDDNPSCPDCPAELLLALEPPPPPATIKTSFDEINKVSMDDINNAASRIYDPNNFILLLICHKDSCATFLERFKDIEYYEQTDELR